MTSRGKRRRRDRPRTRPRKKGRVPAIERSIEFPPEYQQAGVQILSYFSTVLRQKYPDTVAKVNIEQDGLKVMMRIETDEGEIERIEHALDEYGLVLQGEMAPKDYVEDRAAVANLQIQLRMVEMQLENQKELLRFKEIESQTLKDLLDKSLEDVRDARQDFAALQHAIRRSDLPAAEQREAWQLIADLKSQKALPAEERESPDDLKKLAKRLEKLGEMSRSISDAWKQFGPSITNALGL